MDRKVFIDSSFTVPGKGEYAFVGYQPLTKSPGSELSWARSLIRSKAAQHHPHRNSRGVTKMVSDSNCTEGRKRKSNRDDSTITRVDKPPKSKSRHAQDIHINQLTAHKTQPSPPPSFETLGIRRESWPKLNMWPITVERFGSRAPDPFDCHPLQDLPSGSFAQYFEYSTYKQVGRAIVCL